MEFFAHTGKKGRPNQLLKSHLEETARIAGKMGKDIGMEEISFLAGLMHDIGKYSLSFQQRLNGTAGKVDHSTAGAREIINLLQDPPQNKPLGEILAYCIAGHHSGLPDIGSSLDVGGEGTLRVRLNAAKTRIDDYSVYKSEITLPLSKISLPKIRPTPGFGWFSISFLIRMIYSILVDADWIETETFMEGKNKPRGEFDSIEELCRIANQYIEKFNSPKTEINTTRTETLHKCLEKSSLPQGIFTLTIPTGGGKTLTSMAFALNHAVKHNLKRIIYVIPFTGIIEQNAEVFKNILRAKNVLEHHSNFDWDEFSRLTRDSQNDDETLDTADKLRLAAENWDVPVVFTTNVQFFESLFASKKTRCRKLHNIANSVIIFDEAQVLPRDFLQPCMLAIQELVQNYGVSVVLCTATQPSLHRFIPKSPDFTELTDNPSTLFSFYKRVSLTNLGKITDETLLNQINREKQALIIVNTKKHAKGLFTGLDSNGRFHLSTWMCPAHRKEKLFEIKDRLAKGEPCRVISTQVMEAGIDVDFPVGWRALAGVDSIIQAAGRINREARQPSATLFVFEPDSSFIKSTPAYIKQTSDICRIILREFPDDPINIEAINAYYDMLYTVQDENDFDARRILPHLNRQDGFDFRTAGEKFRLIDNLTVPIIIPYNEEAKRLISELYWEDNPTSVLRKLQLFVVNVYESELNNLISQGKIEFIHDRFAVLNDLNQYDRETGIILPERETGVAMFFE